MNARNLFLIISLLALGLSGCGTTRPQQTGLLQDSSYHKPSTDVSGVEAGDIVAVDTDTSGVPVEGYFGVPYASASGKICRYFHPVSRGSVTRTVCKIGEEWFFQKSLSQNVASATRSNALGAGADTTEDDVSGATLLLLGEANTQRSILPRRDSLPLEVSGMATDAQEISVEEDSVIAELSSSFVIRNGENLWTFSRRITGAGKHWPLIAKANGITEEDNVFAGTELNVPQSLVLDR